jgi:hypothetical protein
MYYKYVDIYLKSIVLHAKLQPDSLLTLIHSEFNVGSLSLRIS